MQKYLREYYEQFDGDLDERAYNSDLFVQKFWQRNKIDHIMTSIKSGDFILDVGSGSGIISHRMSKNNNVVSLDVSLKCIKNCLKLNPKIMGVVANASALPFKKNVFDKVVCIEVIEHIYRPEKCIKEIVRVLRKGSVLLLTTPNFRSVWVLIEYIWDVFGRGREYRTQHVSKLNISRLSNLLDSNGLGVNWIKTIFLITPIMAVFSGWLTKLVMPLEYSILRRMNIGMLITVSCKKL